MGRKRRSVKNHHVLAHWRNLIYSECVSHLTTEFFMNETFFSQTFSGTFKVNTFEICRSGFNKKHKQGKHLKLEPIHLTNIT